MSELSKVAKSGGGIDLTKMGVISAENSLAVTRALGLNCSNYPTLDGDTYLFCGEGSSRLESFAVFVIHRDATGMTSYEELYNTTSTTWVISKHPDYPASMINVTVPNNNVYRITVTMGVLP